MKLKDRVGAWYREPELDYDDGQFREYAYEHDSGWMTVRIEGSDEHDWKVQGSTDYRNEVYISNVSGGPGRFETVREAAQFAYKWMRNNTDISRWTKMDRAAEWSNTDKYNRTGNGDEMFDDLF